MRVRILIAVLWPAFLVAGLAEGVLFSMVDPQDIRVFGMDLELSAKAIYTIGLCLLWGMCALSGMLSGYVITGLRDPMSDAIDGDASA